MMAVHRWGMVFCFCCDQTEDMKVLRLVLSTPHPGSVNFRFAVLHSDCERIVSAADHCVQRAA